MTDIDATTNDDNCYYRIQLSIVEWPPVRTPTLFESAGMMANPIFPAAFCCTEVRGWLTFFYIRPALQRGISFQAVSQKGQHPAKTFQRGIKYYYTRRRCFLDSKFDMDETIMVQSERRDIDYRV